MIVCNRCGSIFANQEELSKILEVSEKDNDGVFCTIGRSIYDCRREVVCNENHHEEVFNGCGFCCSDEYLMDIDKDYDCLNDAQIESIWDVFGDVSLDEDECLENEWFGFPKGTDKIDIWRWFDEHHSKGVYYLLYERDLH